MARMETEQALLNEIAKLRGSAELNLFRKWLTALLEGTKDELVTCPPASLEKLQGEAHAYRNMLRRIERSTYTSE